MSPNPSAMNPIMGKMPTLGERVANPAPNASAKTNARRKPVTAALRQLVLDPLLSCASTSAAPFVAPKTLSPVELGERTV